MSDYEEELLETRFDEFDDDGEFFDDATEL